MDCKSYVRHFSSNNFSPLHENLSIGSHFNFPIVQFHPCQNSTRGAGRGHTCYSGFSPFLYPRKDGIMFQCGNENEFRFPTGKEKSEEGLLPNINSITTLSDPIRVEVLADWRDQHRARPLRLPRKLLRHRSAMGRVSLIELRCNSTPFLQISPYLCVSGTSCSMASQPEPCRSALQAVL